MLCFVAQHLMRVMRLSLVILCILRYAARAHTTSLYQQVLVPRYLRYLRYLLRYQYGTVGSKSLSQRYVE